MTAKKKTWSYNPLSHDSDHADGGLSGLANLGLTPLAPSTPPAAASMVAKVATWAAADASSTPGSVAAAVLPYTGNTPPPPPPSVAPVDANVETLAASAQKLAPLAPTVTDKVSKVYQHWADGDFANPSDDEWNNNILSANKSDYSEGEVIPHVFAFKASSQVPLVPGQTYSFNITYNHYQANTNSGGFVGLDTFNLSRDPDSWPANGAPTADSTFVNNGGTAGMFHTVNADITNVSAATYSGAGTRDGHVTVTFVYSGPEETSSGSALIYYGLKIAGPGDVSDQGQGETNGAHMWTGGSLQTTVDIGGSGATSIQLSPAAILVPELTIDKTVLGVYESDGVTPDSDGIADAAGDIVKYNVRVTNTGEVALTGVTVTDPLTGQDITGVTLAIGAFADYASQYTVQQSDLDNEGGGDGDIDNTATADSNQTDPVSDSATAPLAYTPALAIAKTFLGFSGGNGNTLGDWSGDVLAYRVTVTNNGNVTLTGVTVNDPLTGQNISGVSLSPGESKSYDSQYVLTQEDLDNRGGGDDDVDNTATADSNQTGATSASAIAPLVYTPALSIDKVFDEVTGGNGNAIADAAGDVLNYSIVVSNTGNITLTGITVVDPLTGQNLSGITLDPGTTQTFGSSYTLTQDDLDAQGGGDGDIDNTATVDSNETDPSSDSETVPLAYLPVLAIAKSYDSVTGGNQNDKIDLPGEVLNYTVTVTNNGNVTLTNVTVVDPLTGQNLSGITLTVGETQTFTSTYTVTQDDLDNNGGGDGDIDNTASADSDQTDMVSASASAPLDFIPALAIVKTFLEVTGGNGNAVADAAGDVIRYRVTVTNTDGATLTNVSIVDPLTGQNLSGITLAAGESLSFDSSYVLQQSDLDTQGGGDGDLDNTATADSDQTDPVSDSEEVPLVYAPDLTIDKVVDEITGGNENGVADFAGDVLNYRVLVRNSGNITLTGVTVVDPLTGQDLGDITLAVGETQTFASSYTLTQADLDTNGGGDGHIENTATADSNETDPVSDSERVDLSVRPSLSINKVLAEVTGGNGNLLADAASDQLNYEVTVSNLGNVTLTNVSVVDPLTGLNQTGLTLAPGETQTFGSVYELTQADLDGDGGGDGDIDNEATADSDQTDAISDAETVQLLRTTGLQIIKSFVNLTGGNGNVLADTAGDILNYQIIVSNVGTTTLHNVVTTSSLTSFSDTLPTLLPGESQTYLTSYTLQQADLDNNGGGDGTLENDAVAVADETGPTFDSETVQLFVSPVMFLSKLFLDVTGGNGNSVADAAGDQINYRLILANPGNVTLTNVDLVEPLTGFALNDLTLAPNQADVYFTTYTLQQSDLDTNGGGDGYIDNIVNATSDQANPVTDGDQVPLLLTRSMSFDAAFTGVTGGNGNALADAAGDVLNFSYAIANLGNVTLTDVSITDPLTGATVSGVTLAPGASDVYTGSYTLQQSDLDSNGGGDGRVESAATASSNETGLATDNEYVTVIYDPRVNLVKYVSVDGGSTWNDANSPTGPEATSAPQFRFVVSNTGTVTLGDVRLTDSTYDLNGADPGTDYAVGSLAPGQSAELVFADTLLVAGQQVNSASVSVVGMPTVSDSDNAYYLGVVV